MRASGQGMSLYVALGRFTDQGRKAIKDAPRRNREAKSLAEKSGLKIHQSLFTTGRYDLVAIIEAPNEQAALAGMLGSAADGIVYWETLHAYTAEEIEKVVSKLP